MDKHNLLENELMFLQEQTISEFLKQENSAELISFYMTYYYALKWENVKPDDLDSHIATKLSWDLTKAQNIHKQLVGAGVI